MSAAIPMISDSIVRNDRMHAGKITLAPGEDVGEHITEKREELIVVLKGVATIVEESLIIEKKAGETHHVAESIRHNVRNDGTDTLEYIYVVAVASVEREKMAS
jgi:mannose-6-phosphate isomerase-like protein (cupin superfamily)